MDRWKSSLLKRKIMMPLEEQKTNNSFPKFLFEEMIVYPIIILYGFNHLIFY